MVSAHATILLFFLATTLVSVLGNPVPEGGSRVRRHGVDCSKCKWEDDDYWEQDEEEEEEEEEEDWDECGDDQEHSKPDAHHGPEKIGGHPPPAGSTTYGPHPASPFESGHGQGSPGTGKIPGAYPGSYLDHPPTHGNDGSSHVKGKPPQSPNSWSQPPYSPPSYSPEPWKTQPTPAHESDQATRSTFRQNFQPTTPSPKSYHPPAVITTGASDTVTPTHSWSWPNAQGKGDHSGAAAKGRPQHHPDAWDHKPSPSSSHGCVDGDNTGGAPCNQGPGRQGGNGPVTKQAAPKPVDGQTGSAPSYGPQKVQGSPSGCSGGGNCGTANSAPSSPNSPNQGSTAPPNHPTGRSDIPVELKTHPFPGTSTSFPSQARDRPSSGVPSPADGWNKPVGRPPGIPQAPPQSSHPKDRNPQDQNPHQPKHGGTNTQQTLAPTFGSPSGPAASTPNHPPANNCGGNSQSGGNCKGSDPHSPPGSNHPYPIDQRGGTPSTGDGSHCGSSSGKSACDGGHGGAPLTKNAAPLPNSAGTPLVPPYPAQSGQQPPAYQPQPQSQLHPPQQPQSQPHPQLQPQSPPSPYAPSQSSHPKDRIPQDQNPHQPNRGGTNTQQTLAPTFGSSSGPAASTPNHSPANNCGGNSQSGGNCKGSDPHSPAGVNPSTGDGSHCGSSSGQSGCDGGHGGAPLTKNAAPLPNSAGTPLVPPYPAQSGQQPPAYQPQPQPQPQLHPPQQPQVQPYSPPSPGTHGCTQGGCAPAPTDSAAGCSSSRCNGHDDKNKPPYIEKISPSNGADSLQTPPYKSNPANPFLNGMLSHLSPASDNHMGMSPTAFGMPGAGGPGMLGKGNPFLEGTIPIQPGQPKWSNPSAQDYGKGSPPSQPGQPKWDNPTAPDYGKGSPPYPGESHKPIGKGNPFLGSEQGKPQYSPETTGSHDPNGYTKNVNSPNPWSGTPYGNHASSVPIQNGIGFGGAAAGAFASAGAFAGAFGSPLNDFAGPQSGFPHNGVGNKSPMAPEGIPVSPYGSYDSYDPHAYPYGNEQQKESPYSGVKGKFGPWASGTASAYSSASASSWAG